MPIRRATGYDQKISSNHYNHSNISNGNIMHSLSVDIKENEIRRTKILIFSGNLMHSFSLKIQNAVNVIVSRNNEWFSVFLN